MVFGVALETALDCVGDEKCLAGISAWISVAFGLVCLLQLVFSALGDLTDRLTHRDRPSSNLYYLHEPVEFLPYNPGSSSDFDSPLFYGDVPATATTVRRNGQVSHQNSLPKLYLEDGLENMNSVGMDQVPRSLDIPQMRMTRRRDTSPIFVQRRADSDEDHGSLVGKTLTQIVEMCYWVVKFVGDFEKGSGLDLEEHGRIFGGNSASIIKLIRYTVKFVKSFEKLF